MLWTSTFLNEQRYRVSNMTRLYLLAAVLSLFCVTASGKCLTIILFGFLRIQLGFLGLGEILCYSCISQGGGDDSCITNPALVSNSIIKCKYKYCTIRRLEYTADPGNFYNFPFES